MAAGARVVVVDRGEGSCRHLEAFEVSQPLNLLQNCSVLFLGDEVHLVPGYPVGDDGECAVALFQSRPDLVGEGAAPHVHEGARVEVGDDDDAFELLVEFSSEAYRGDVQLLFGAQLLELVFEDGVVLLDKHVQEAAEELQGRGSDPPLAFMFDVAGEPLDVEEADQGADEEAEGAGEEAEGEDEDGGNEAQQGLEDRCDEASSRRR